MSRKNVVDWSSISRSAYPTSQKSIPLIGQYGSAVKEEITAYEIPAKSRTPEYKKIGEFNGRHHFLDAGLAHYDFRHDGLLGICPRLRLSLNLVESKRCLSKASSHSEGTNLAASTRRM